MDREYMDREREEVYQLVRIKAKELEEAKKLVRCFLEGKDERLIHLFEFYGIAYFQYGLALGKRDQIETGYLEASKVILIDDEDVKG